MRRRRRCPFFESPFESDIPSAILLVPLWWILGVTNIIFHVLSVFLLLKLLLQKSKTRDRLVLPAYLFFLLVFVTIFVMAIFFNLQGIPTIRLFATGYNLSFWLIALILFTVIHNTARMSHFFPLMRGFVALGVMNGVLSIVGTILWWLDRRDIVIQSLLGLAIKADRIPSNMPLIQYFFRLRVVTTDWVFNKSVPRSFGFNPYPTALGLMMLFSISMTLGYYFITKRKRLLVALLIQLIPLTLSFSRAAVLGLVTGIVAVYTLQNIGKLAFVMKFAAIAGLLVVISLNVSLRRVAEGIDQFRAESTSFRMNMYERTFEEALKKPFIGYGFKPLEKDVPFPMASHSSYVGVIYRAGFLGFGAFILFFASILFSWWKQKSHVMGDLTRRTFWFWGGVCILGGLVWMMTEDLDAPVLLAFLFFVIIGYACSLKHISPEDGSGSSDRAVLLP